MELESIIRRFVMWDRIEPTCTQTSFGRHSFLRWWGVGVFPILESWGLLLLRSKLFYCLRLPFKLILGEVTKKCRGLDLGPLKISRIGKTPTPHHRKNAALPTGPVIYWACFTNSHIPWFQDVSGVNLLTKLYEDPKRWAFQFHSYVTVTGLEILNSKMPAGKNTRILERSMHSNR